MIPPSLAEDARSLKDNIRARGFGSPFNVISATMNAYAPPSYGSLMGAAALRNIVLPGGITRNAFTSGLRYELILKDKNFGGKFLYEVLKNHTSGQLKIAPEHTDKYILDIMGKPGNKLLTNFLLLFNKINSKIKKKKFLTYYFIAAHPGCSIYHMKNLQNFIKKNIKIIPEQIQIFTPSPSTYSTLMYYTEKNPFNNKKIFVEKNKKNKELQKNIIIKNKYKNN